jgi:hypothetical protein
LVDGLRRPGDGDEGDVLLEVHVTEALRVLVGERAHAAEEAYIDVLRRHAVKHYLHFLHVTAARRSEPDRVSGFELDDPFFLDEITAAASKAACPRVLWRRRGDSAASAIKVALVPQ